MTVVRALGCADGIVLAADSPITDGARGLSYPAPRSCVIAAVRVLDALRVSSPGIGGPVDAARLTGS